MIKKSISALAMAGALLAAPGCGDDAADLPDAIPGDLDTATVFVVAGDFTAGTGVASTIGIPSLRVEAGVVAGVASDDPLLRRHGDMLYIINRIGHDNITVLEAGTLRFVRQVSTGAGSNPQDVAVKGTTLYVAALAAPGVLVIAEDGTIDTIDLSHLDDDGVPDCNSLYLVGELLVVTCGLLYDYQPVDPGKVVIIDTASHEVASTFDLTTANPFGHLQPTAASSAPGGDLLIPTVIFGQDLDTGCVERIAVTPEPRSAGCLVDNAELGGYASGVAQGADGTLYLAVTTGYDAGGAVAQLRALDVAGLLTELPLTPPGQRIFDVAVCPTGERVLADAAGGLRVHGADGVELTTDVLDIGLPPTSAGLTCY